LVAPRIGGERSKIFLEARVGGRFYESHPDGTEYEVGRVTIYEPPSLIALTWKGPNWDLVTQVEIRFIPDGKATRIELEHSGWEQSETLREARKGHEGGWDTMLGHYQAYLKSAK
jgi:uncharacterized protein YndB with AHSA1/START domain